MKEEKERKKKDFAMFFITLVCWVGFFAGLATGEKLYLVCGPIWICMSIIEGWITNAKDAILEKIDKKASERKEG